MQECIFCKIVRGGIPSAKVYENEKVLCFLDIAPVTRGHCLVIPKEHVENILEMSSQQAGELHEAVRRIAQGMLRGLGAQGFNVGMNNFQAAGQLVMHAHWHVIPRFEGDGLQLWPQGKYDNEQEMHSIVRKLNLAT